MPAWAGTTGPRSPGGIVGRGNCSSVNPGNWAEAVVAAKSESRSNRRKGQSGSASGGGSLD